MIAAPAHFGYPIEIRNEDRVEIQPVRRRHPAAVQFVGALFCCFTLIFLLPVASGADDFDEIRQRGVLVHIGVPYANFVTGGGSGLDVEVMQLFAKSLGLQYRHLPSTWQDALSDLTGTRFVIEDGDPRVVESMAVKGDVIANAMTILPERERFASFGVPTFVSQIWLMARHDSPLAPIVPTGNLEQDIAEVKARIWGMEVLGVADTCLDPKRYGLESAGVKVRNFNGSLNELAPALVNGEAELALLDMTDAVNALDKWSGKLKVIGPVSPMQQMGYAFRKTSAELRQKFNHFYEQIREDGTYLRLVRKYYPSMPDYFPEFFNDAVARTCQRTP